MPSVESPVPSPQNSAALGISVSASIWGSSSTGSGTRSTAASDDRVSCDGVPSSGFAWPALAQWPASYQQCWGRAAYSACMGTEEISE